MVLAMILLYIMAVLTMTSCTVNFNLSNVSSHGYANDLVDERLEADPDIQADVPIHFAD